MHWIKVICLTGTLILVTVVVRGSKGSSGSLPVLPLCPPTKTGAENQKTSNSNVLIVSTLDGQLTALDMDQSGAHLWSIATGPGPMLSSTISQVELTNNKQFMKLIPSLDGSIYKFDGQSVEPVPMNADDLLKASFKFGDNTVMTGGKESRTYGVEFGTGRIIYECTLQGCSRDDESKAEDGLEDILVVQRESQTVRAIESRTGSEKWNFSVSQHHLQYHPSIDDMCEGSVTNDDEQEEDEASEYIDPATRDDGKEIKAVVSEGIICETQKDDILWKHAFPTPIVHAWRLIDGKLTKINLFSTSHIPRRDLPVSEESSLNVKPLIYLGTYKNQHYIQESERQRKSASKLNRDQQMLPFFEFPRVAWRPYLISAPSRTPIINHGSEPPPGLPLLTHDKRTSESTALAVIGDPGAEYPFDSGLYLFPDEPNLDYDLVKDFKNRSKKHHDDFSTDYGLSLIDYWKEVVFISIITALMMNVLITRPIIHRLRENFKLAVERIRLQRDIVVVEKRIEVPVEVKVEVPVPQLTREESLGSSTTTLSSGQTRGQEFVSRFLTDYEPLRCLGYGGFGVVFESKNKIDDVHYAVKRVQLPQREEAKKKVMREVKFLAKLDHKNIVRYYNTWLECPPPEWQKNWDTWWRGVESSTGQSPPDSIKTPFSISSYGGGGFGGQTETSYRPTGGSSLIEDSFDIVFEKSKNVKSVNMEESSGGIVFENSQGVEESDGSEVTPSKAVKSRNNQGSFETSSGQEACEAIVWDEAKRPRSYLYIVMQLCQRESLRHWLKTNLTLDSTVRSIKSKSIFHEICLGVDYVHTQGLIHRDLKPSNIFFSNDGTVKIGDFGLVTGVGPDCETTPTAHLNRGDSKCSNSSFTSANKSGHPAKIRFEDESCSVSMSQMIPEEEEEINCKNHLQQHTDQVGTELYMSPEQLSRKSYNHKVDIYSLGVILFELLVPFGTQMERVLSLRALRNLNFPDNFPESPEASLVRSMVSHDPSKRPDTSEILKMEFFENISHVRKDSFNTA